MTVAVEMSERVDETNLTVQLVVEVLSGAIEFIGLSGEVIVTVVAVGAFASIVVGRLN